MQTTSLWKAISTRIEKYPSLNEDLEVDVAIIGGGITGITSALQLLEAGQSVAVIEAQEIGGVTTSCSTGNLYVAVQPHYQSVVAKFDLTHAKNIAHSRQAAIDHIEKNIREKKIACNFLRRPWYAYSYSEKGRELLKKEVETYKQMGIPLEFTQDLPLKLKFKEAAVLENQGRLNPLQYVMGMAADLKAKGGLIFENSTIVEHKEDEVCTLTTSKQHKIRAHKVIIATHVPIGINTVQFYTAPYRSYVVAVKLKEGTYPHNIYPEGQYVSFDQPSHSTCTHPENGKHPELVMVSGSHHKTGQDGDMLAHYHDMESFLRGEFEVDKVSYCWSAQHYHSADDLPYIGLANRFAKHSYMATGFFADGLVYGTVSGLIIADLILGKANPYEKLFAANRFTPKASASFLVKENINTLAQYYKDLPQKEGQLNELKVGEARVVEIEAEKWGAYRDENKKLHVVSAVCPHMKGIVCWNSAEKSWDCPCHGSRFSYEGKVLEGPAMHDLRKKGE